MQRGSIFKDNPETLGKTKTKGQGGAKGKPIVRGANREDEKGACQAKLMEKKELGGAHKSGMVEMEYCQGGEKPRSEKKQQTRGREMRKGNIQKGQIRGVLRKKKGFSIG